MSDVVLMQAALFQLRAALGSVDESVASQFRLACSVLGTAIEGANDGINAARVNEIGFALNDLHGIAADLGDDDASRVLPILQMLQTDVDRLRQETALPGRVIDAMRDFQKKLKTRRSAIERQTYREGATAEELPHPPGELMADALALRDDLQAAGFATEAIDAFVDDPESLRFHSISAMVDELDVILGA